MPVVSLARVVRSADSFRPEGSEDLELWTMIDLRPPGSREGICLLGSSEAPAGAITLTDDPSKDSITSRRLLQNGVGVNVAGKHLGRQILGLMLDGKKDGSRWRPLMPSRHAWEVWLGNECIDRVPVVAGGAVSVFDDYNLSLIHI